MSLNWNGVQVIDCQHECTLPRTVIPAGMDWTREDVDDSWKIDLEGDCYQELRTASEELSRQADIDLTGGFSEPQLPDWPSVSRTAKSLKTCLDGVPGFGVLRGLPIEEFADEILQKLYYQIGSEISRPVAQKWNGQMIYDVSDFGQSYQYGVRGSHTSVELVFHTDNAFGISVPDYVGLLCVQPAKSGGVSRFCSLYTLHKRLLERSEKALNRLYQPMLFDRQKEHAPDAPAVTLAPFFSWRRDRLQARANTSLVRKGYEVAGIEPDQMLVDALGVADEICSDEELWYEAPLSRGDIQYLNNHEVGHYRSAFEDFEEPERKRHLYRLWHRDSGTPGYDGLET